MHESCVVALFFFSFFCSTIQTVVARQKSTIAKPPEITWTEIIFPCKTKTSYSADTKIPICENITKGKKTNIGLFEHFDEIASEQNPPNLKQQKLCFVENEVERTDV